jgi:hypothetical protein
MNAFNNRFTSMSAKQRMMFVLGMGLLAMLVISMSAHAVNIATLIADPNNPLASALTTVNSLTPGLKGIILLIGFSVGFISLAALRNFGPVLNFIGLGIFAAVGLPVVLAIAGYAV